MVNIKDFDWSLLQIAKKSYKNIGIYYIRYVTMKRISDYENINSPNLLYLIIGEVNRYIGEGNGNKYLTFASTAKNKEVLTRYTELWDEIKYLMMTINGSEASEYEKHFMKIRFESDDNLSLNIILKLHILTVIVRSVFQKFF